jgi:hypothetical protein
VNCGVLIWESVQDEKRMPLKLEINFELLVAEGWWQKFDAKIEREDARWYNLPGRRPNVRFSPHITAERFED